MTILRAVQYNRYKNGLFVTSITPRTDIMHDLNVLINSTQVMALDVLRLVNVRLAVQAIRDDQAMGKEYSNIHGQKIGFFSIHGTVLVELEEVLYQKDQFTNALWEQHYGNSS